LNVPGKLCSEGNADVAVRAKFRAPSYSDRFICPGRRYKFLFLSDTGHSKASIGLG